MNTNKVMFPSSDLSIEGISSIPDSEGPFAAVVVCHPHPLYGGTMDNNVIIAVCQALSDISIASLRFNFRGVGRSQGSHAHGIGEQDDIISALSFISSANGVAPDRIGLCGYSFGAGVALEVAAREERVKALALISPVSSHLSPLKNYPKPTLILWGSEDQFILDVDLSSYINDMTGHMHHEIIVGADHFWWSYEDTVATKVASFFADSLI